jgi:hypothetical protein
MGKGATGVLFLAQKSDKTLDGVTFSVHEHHRQENVTPSRHTPQKPATV